MTLRLTTKILRLPLKVPLKINHGVFPERRSLILSISGDGHTGYGEASEITYYDWDINHFLKKLEQKRTLLEDLKIEDPRNIKPYLEKLFPDAFPLQSAIDCALWDLYTQKHEKSLRDFLNLTAAHTPLSSYTIGLDNPDVMLGNMKKSTWPLLKLKLGGPDDLAFLKQLLSIKQDKTLRIDVNEGWTLTQLEQGIKIAEKLDIQLIEQPLPVTADKDLKYIRSDTSIPIIADESCQTIDDVEKCAEYYDGINIKLMKCGGISSFLSMAEKAREMDIQVMGGCMTETSIGISALCQLAPLMTYIDADGAELLAEQLASGVKVQEGKIYYPPANGIGAKLL